MCLWVAAGPVLASPIGVSMGNLYFERLCLEEVCVEGADF